MSSDVFAIYQIDNSEKNREYRCRSYEYQIQHGFMITADNYGTGYSGTASRGMGAEAIRKKMESINPDKFKIRKFGVSDVIGLTAAGKTSFFYVDKDRLVRFNGFFPKPQSGTYLILDEGGYQVVGQKGTWLVSDEVEVDGQRFVQMRSEQTKNPPPSIILHESGAFVTQTALGFDGEATRKMRDWVIVDNTHEAIVPAEQYELVQRILETETRRPNDAETVALFAGFLYCGDCGSRLVRRSASYKGKRYIYYQCSGSKQNKRSCTSHNLRDEKLYNIVRNALQMQIQIVMEEAEFVESIRQAQQEPYRVRRIERQIRQLTAEKAHTQGIKEKLYGDYADEILTREDFLNYNELYSKRIEENDRKITELEAERQNLQTAPNAYPFLDVYRKYRKLEEITRPMVVELIEKIEVYEGNRVEITFRFHDEIADLLEELHQKQHEVSA